MSTTLRTILALISLAGACPALLASAATPGSAQDVRVQWTATIEMHPERVSLAEERAAGGADVLHAQGVSFGTIGTQLALAGGQGLEQLRTVLFHSAADLADFLGGPVELTLTLPAGSPSLTLNMQARTTTGYRWEVVSADGGANDARSGAFTRVPRSHGQGVPSIQTVRIQPASTGETVVRLRYRRSFGPELPVHAQVSVQVTDVTDVIDVSDPTPPAPPATETEAVSGGASPYTELAATALPSSWDWRTSGIVPAVRDQGSCGSCWAFGTVGVMESAVKKAGGALEDLSEQFLLSCNKDSWNCEDGGWTAHKYHYNKLATSQTTIGAVLESAKPYTATDGTCTVALNHPYKLSNWKFVSTSEATMATVDEIKTAIYTYGPVTAGVCADDGWDNYSGGVYSPTSNQCDGSTNHQIILVGWNDSTASWILRNSWGRFWGESGYMRIAWDAGGTTSRVGEGTSWVLYTTGTTPPPTFTDDPLVRSTTKVKAVHITELRSAINTLRASHGLATYSWTDTTLTTGSTSVKAVHLSELRTALSAVYSAAGRTAPTFSDATLKAKVTVVTAAQIAELRAAVLAIW